MRGEIDFNESFAKRMALLEGLDTSSRRLSAALSNLGYKKANRVTIDAERHSLYLAAGLSGNDSMEIAMALESEEMTHDEVFSVF